MNYPRLPHHIARLLLGTIRSTTVVCTVLTPAVPPLLSSTSIAASGSLRGDTNHDEPLDTSDRRYTDRRSWDICSEPLRVKVLTTTPHSLCAQPPHRHPKSESISQDAWPSAPSQPVHRGILHWSRHLSSDSPCGRCFVHFCRSW